MSRGLGSLQRAIIEITEVHDAPTWSLGAPAVAALLGVKAGSDNMVRRALPRLEREGAIAPTRWGTRRLVVESFDTRTKRLAYTPTEGGKWWCVTGYLYRQWGLWKPETQALHVDCCAPFQHGVWSTAEFFEEQAKQREAATKALEIERWIDEVAPLYGLNDL